MSEIGDIYRQTAAKWNEVTDQISDDQWSAATNCDGWTVRDLVDHTMQWQATGAGMLGAQGIGADDWRAVEAAISEALDDPARLEGEVDGMQRSQAAGFLIGDLLIHSWDLARAIGADDTLPPAAVAATAMGLQRVPEEVLRGENMFGPVIDLTDSASDQDKLVAYCGRQP